MKLPKNIKIKSDKFTILSPPYHPDPKNPLCTVKQVLKHTIMQYLGILAKGQEYKIEFKTKTYTFIIKKDNAVDFTS